MKPHPQFSGNWSYGIRVLVYCTGQDMEEAARVFDGVRIN